MLYLYIIMLIKDEMEYGLTIWGIQSSGSCKVFVKLFQELLLLEKYGKVFTSYRIFDPKVEINICKSKLEEIEQLHVIHVHQITNYVFNRFIMFRLESIACVVEQEK